MRVTDASHVFVSPALGLGTIHLDATCGNGNDTVFLLRNAPDQHKVIAVDIQEAAIRATTDLVTSSGIDPNRLIPIHGDHADLSRHLPASPTLGIAIFNLGYLPGGDHTLITRAASTLAALDAAHRALVPGGRLAVVIYPDHPGGRAEAEAVDAWFRAAGLPTPTRPLRGPYLQSLIR